MDPRIIALFEKMKGNYTYYLIERDPTDPEVEPSLNFANRLFGGEDPYTLAEGDDIEKVLLDAAEALDL